MFMHIRYCLKSSDSIQQDICPCAYIWDKKNPVGCALKISDNIKNKDRIWGVNCLSALSLVLNTPWLQSCLYIHEGIWEKSSKFRTSCTDFSVLLTYKKRKRKEKLSLQNYLFYLWFVGFLLFVSFIAQHKVLFEIKLLWPFLH